MLHVFAALCELVLDLREQIQKVLLGVLRNLEIHLKVVLGFLIVVRVTGFVELGLAHLVDVVGRGVRGVVSKVQFELSKGRLGHVFVDVKA